jgi:hypothetical protein
VKIRPDIDQGGIDTTQHTVVGFQCARTVMRIARCKSAKTCLAVRDVVVRKVCGDKNIAAKCSDGDKNISATGKIARPTEQKKGSLRLEIGKTSKKLPPTQTQRFSRW